MGTIWKVLQSKLFLVSVLVAVVALMVPMALALAGSNETKIAFSGERIFSPSPFVGDTLEFEVDNAGPGLSGLSGSGEFFDASESVTEPFVITDSSIERIPTPVGGYTDAIVLKDGDLVTRVTIEFDAASPSGPPNGMRVRYFDSSGTFKGVYNTRFSLFELELEVKAQ
ncbi:MAG: hypothetical protein IH960_14530 [Chloroflexi bacterium]|nr:hypothetical protein [Chloroflexota bacterium]